MKIPEGYLRWRSTLEIGEIAYGAGGITLYPAEELALAQFGHAVDKSGRSLVDDAPGSWSSDWLVIGYESACGDPIYLSLTPPHPVFSSARRQGRWKQVQVAPSLETFVRCLDRFRLLATRRGSPVELEQNKPEDDDIRAYLVDVLRIYGKDRECIGFWATQAEIGMDDDEWHGRLERLFATGELD